MLRAVGSRGAGRCWPRSRRVAGRRGLPVPVDAGDHGRRRAGAGAARHVRRRAGVGAVLPHRVRRGAVGDAGGHRARRRAGTGRSRACGWRRATGRGAATSARRRPPTRPASASPCGAVAGSSGPRRCGEPGAAAAVPDPRPTPGRSRWAASRCGSATPVVAQVTSGGYGYTVQVDRLRLPAGGRRGQAGRASRWRCDGRSGSTRPTGGDLGEAPSWTTRREPGDSATWTRRRLA